MMDSLGDAPAKAGSRAAELESELAQERGIASDALAEVELLNQQLGRCGASLRSSAMRWRRPKRARASRRPRSPISGGG
jgi:hypothetical protein